MHRAVSEALFQEQVMGLEGALLDERGWRVFERAFPVLDVMFDRPGRIPLRVRLLCNDWNDMPPSITLHDSQGALLTTLPTGSGVFNSSAHPRTGRPFICMAGSLEYHTHDSHTSDHWENYRSRGGYDIGGVVTQIWNAWLRTTP